jgi:hypothetical protein
MKQTRFLVIALVSMLALGGATMAVAGKGKKKKFETSIEARYVPGNSGDPYDPYANAKFKGSVDSKKSFCIKERKVVATSKATDEKIGSDLTTNAGQFKIDASGVSSGKYEIKVKKKSSKKKVCQEAEATVKVD